MFSLRHFTFSPPWPRCGKWKIYKFLPIRSAVNLSLSPPRFFFFSLSPGPRGQFSLAFLNTVRLPPPSWPSATACVYFKTLLVLLLLLPFTQQREASAHSYTLPHTHTRALQPILCRLVCVTSICVCRTQQIYRLLSGLEYKA